MLKSIGYLVSTASVLLLGIVSWSSASKDPLLLACLVLGMMMSGFGMFLRWLSYRETRARKAGAVAQLAGAPASICEAERRP